MLQGGRRLGVFALLLTSTACFSLLACGSDREFGENTGGTAGTGGKSGSGGKSGTGGSSGTGGDAGAAGDGSGGSAAAGGTGGSATGGQAGTGGSGGSSASGGTGGSGICTPNTTRCEADTLRTCDDDGSSEVSTACPSMQFCGRDPAACHPYVVAGYATPFTSGYIYPNNDGDAVNEIVGFSWTLTERIELRSIGMVVYEPTSPEASVIRFMIVADDNPANPEAGTILHEQNFAVTNAAGSDPDTIEVDASAPVLLGPGKIWLLLQAPPPVLIASDWDATTNVEWTYHGTVGEGDPTNIFIRGAVR